MLKARTVIGLLFILISQGLLADDTQADNNRYFMNEPGWVKKIKPDLKQKVPVDRVKDGTHYVLVDSQVQVTREGKATYYQHFVEHIINPKGIENSSQLNIDFNPEFQKLVMHKLRVWRNGKPIDKSASSRITVIQPERESNENIYSGEQSLNIILEDIRVGDIVEYSYSRAGRNPVFGQHFDLARTLQWGVPVGEVYRRVLWQKPTQLVYKTQNTDAQVKTAKLKGATEYSIKLTDVPAVNREDKTPDWYTPYARVMFSDTRSWIDVAGWGVQLFDESLTATSAVKDIAADIRQNHPRKDEQIVAALQYVQNKIRYLSLSIGENSHRPAKPETTIKRRYGDCKDKSTLYIALLREMGVTAHPVLVNTDLEHKIKDRIPAYGIFDHAIVQVDYEGKKYWFDPTRQYQYGAINEIFQPDYGYALVVKPGSNALESMKQPSVAHGIKSHEVFDVNVKDRDNVTYNITTSYHGLDAEFERDRIASRGKQSLQESYLKFYKGYYPGLQSTNDLKVTDDVDSSKIDVEENYKIDNFWSYDKKERSYVADFYTTSISSYLKKPKLKTRDSPYRISHPISIEQNIIVNLNEGKWSFKEGDAIENNDFFFFRRSIKYDEKSKKLALRYYYKSKTYYIPVERYSDYVSVVNKAYNKLDYAITYGPIDQDDNDSESNNENSSDNTTHNDSDNESRQEEKEKETFLEEYLWEIIISVYLGLLLLAIGLWVAAEKRKPDAGETVYYPVTVTKFLLMWIFTIGIYSVYWFYRNYYFIKQRDTSSIMPKARGLFNPLWYFPLYKDLTRYQALNQSNATIPSVYVGGLMAVLFLAANILAGLDVYSALTTLIAGLLVIPMVNYIEHINDSDSEVMRYNSGYGVRHLVLLMISTPLILVLVASETGLIPSNQVIKGEKLYHHDLKFMQRNNIVNPDDRIILFYSDGFLSVQEDGNGFTDHHVFSYWKEEGEMNVEVAKYNEIKDFEVTWSDNFTDNTVIKIIRKDDTDFLLYVSREKRKDKKFVNELKRKWQEAK